MSHKVIFFNSEPWIEDYIKKNEILSQAGVEVSFLNQLLDKDHLPEDINFDIIGLFTDSIADADVIQSLPNLKHITVLSTGHENIDTIACSEKGISVSYAPVFGEHTVAEFTFALILALSRKICETNQQVRKEGNFHSKGSQGFDITNKTLGVLGTGHIGKNVIRIAGGFGMKVLAYDISPDNALASELRFEYKPLADVLSNSDIITIHVPYSQTTKHLINDETIDLMKDGVYIINTARGGVIDTDSLINALNKGKIAGAGLDVLDEEEMMKNTLNNPAGSQLDNKYFKTVLEDHILIDMPNVIITPHNAHNTKEAILRIADIVIQNILGFINENPINIVQNKEN